MINTTYNGISMVPDEAYQYGHIYTTPVHSISPLNQIGWFLVLKCFEKV